jgi:hypothetical protein
MSLGITSPGQGQSAVILGIDLHAFDRLLGYAGFWRIALIIGGIDRQESGFDTTRS